MKTKQLKQTFFNQWESRGFHKLVLDFINRGMILVKDILKIKIKFFSNAGFTMQIPRNFI